MATTLFLINLPDFKCWNTRCVRHFKGTLLVTVLDDKDSLRLSGDI
jgi:hypothetical protein